MNDLPRPVPGQTYEAVISSADAETRRHAIDLHNQGILTAQTDKALAFKMLASSVDVDPSFFQGWFQVGCALADGGFLDAAVAAFRRCLEISPGDVKVLVNMGHRLFNLGRLKECRRVLERATEVDPKSSWAWMNLSLLESVDGNMQKAVRLGRRAFDLDKDPAIETGLALTLMMAGHYAEGLKRFEARFPYKLTKFLSYPAPQWHGDDLTGKTLFIESEQGMGDTLSFIRFVPAVAEKAASVVMAIQPELLRVFSDVLGPLGNVTILPLSSPFPAMDFWSTIGSLPVGLGLSDFEIEHYPGLLMPDYRTMTPWKAPGRKLHVGIAWAGAPLMDLDKFRSMQVLDFLSLYRCPGVQLYSLQVGPRAAELHNSGCGALIKDLSPYIHEVADTMAIVRELDLVVTIESAVGHVCGVLDKECWVTVAKRAGDWRIGRAREKPIWYPRTRLFRQHEDAQWGLVLDDLVEALKKRVTV